MEYIQATFTLDPACSFKFSSFRCLDGVEPVFYRVFDNLEPLHHPQAPPVNPRTIEFGDPETYLSGWVNCIAFDKIRKAFNWVSTDAPNFIPVWDDRGRAVAEARRRVRQPYVWDEANRVWLERDLRSVGIAVVHARKLDDHDAFYFSTSQLRDSVNFQLSHPLAMLLNEGEWFVVGKIPAGSVNTEHSLERCDGMDASTYYQTRPI